MEKQLIPQLRFPEFDGKWNKINLGDIASFSKGKNVSKNDVSEEGVNECIRYGELYTTYNETISEVFSKTNLSIDESVVSQANDVIIPASGETQLDIATASCVLRDGIILGGDLNIIRTKNSGVFLSYYLNNKGKIDIARLSQGSSVIHLYSKQISTLKISFPSLTEQQKIASFLTALDDKITQLTEKKALLEQYKKGMMQQLFSQGIRFKDDDGEDYPVWEEKTLGEISNKIGYGIPSSAIEFDGKNKYLRITDIDENTNKFDPKPLTSPHGQINAKYILKENDLVFARTGASVGKSYLYSLDDGNLVFAGFLIKFSIQTESAKFIFYNTLTSRYNKWVQVMSMRSGQPGLNAEELKSFKINTPCMDEQTKIANFLSALDDKIDQVDHQIEKTTAFKKGLLQQMFV